MYKTPTWFFLFFCLIPVLNVLIQSLDSHSRLQVPDKPLESLVQFQTVRHSPQKFRDVTFSSLLSYFLHFRQSCRTTTYSFSFPLRSALFSCKSVYISLLLISSVLRCPLFLAAAFEGGSLFMVSTFDGAVCSVASLVTAPQISRRWLLHCPARAWQNSWRIPSDVRFWNKVSALPSSTDVTAVGTQSLAQPHNS